MARKKQEITLQQELNMQDEWDEIMTKEGLLVVDVYQDWCGPCKAVVNLFKRIKNETGDDLLNFAVAKADTIDCLERYRGTCEPCFLLYGGGSLVAVVRGANPPVLESEITTKLQEEHDVLHKGVSRKEFKDPAFAYLDELEQEALEDKDTQEVEREVTLALIKPDVVRENRVNEVIDKITEAGIEILDQQERELTEEEVRQFYAHLSENDWFEDYVTFMQSGPSYLLVLSKGDEGIVSEFRELIGPTVVEEAKEKAPDSLRALFGSQSMFNGIHGTDSKENVINELAFFFPDFVIPKLHKKKVAEAAIQRTCAIIRPDAYSNNKDEIIQSVRDAGFSIVMQKELTMTREDVDALYKDATDREYYEDLVAEMCKGPSLVLALARKDAVEEWSRLVGPKVPQEASESEPNSLRARYIKDANSKINQFHAAQSEAEASSDLERFFPVENTLAMIKPDAYDSQTEILESIQEAGFTVVAKKQMEMTTDLAAEFYGKLKNEEYYDDLINHISTGKSMVLVLSREDAIAGWKKMIGDKDPEKAAEEWDKMEVKSLRAVYGKNVKENAVHGASTEEEARTNMQLIFNTSNVDEIKAQSEEQEKEEREKEQVEQAEHEQHEQDKSAVGEPAEGEAGTGTEQSEAAGEEEEPAEGGAAATATEGEPGSEEQTGAAEHAEQAEAEDGAAGSPGETEGGQAAGDDNQEKEGEGEAAKADEAAEEDEATASSDAAPEAAPAGAPTEDDAAETGEPQKSEEETANAGGVQTTEQEASQQEDGGATSGEAAEEEGSATAEVAAAEETELGNTSQSGGEQEQEESSGGAAAPETETAGENTEGAAGEDSTQTVGPNEEELHEKETAKTAEETEEEATHQEDNSQTDQPTESEQQEDSQTNQQASETNAKETTEEDDKTAPTPATEGADEEQSKSATAADEQQKEGDINSEASYSDKSDIEGQLEHKIEADSDHENSVKNENTEKTETQPLQVISSSSTPSPQSPDPAQ